MDFRDYLPVTDRGAIKSYYLLLITLNNSIVLLTLGDTL